MSEAGWFKGHGNTWGTWGAHRAETCEAGWIKGCGITKTKWILLENYHIPNAQVKQVSRWVNLILETFQYDPNYDYYNSQNGCDMLILSSQKCKTESSGMCCSNDKVIYNHWISM